MRQRIVVAVVGGAAAMAHEVAVQLREEGAEVVWLGNASVAAIVNAAEQEAADKVVLVGAGDDCETFEAGLRERGADVEVSVVAPRGMGE